MSKLKLVRVNKNYNHNETIKAVGSCFSVLEQWFTDNYPDVQRVDVEVSSAMYHLGQNEHNDFYIVPVEFEVLD